jgi:hypothetical protein
MRTAAPLLALALAACFPTLQTARVDPGLHLDAGVSYLADQPRNGEPQGDDYLTYLTPSYGFGNRVEIGMPIGYYHQEGLDDRHALLMPYLKVAALGPASRDHLAIGASWAVAGRPMVEVGILHNHYREGARFGDFGQPTSPRTLHDLFVAVRVGVGR